MALKLVSRTAWGARAPRSAATHLASTRGVKVHYTGDFMDPRMVDDHDRCAPRVRSIQNDHIDGNSWNDIGYTALVCPHGYVFVGRGPHRLPAANGPGLNSGHYGVCGLVGNKGLTEPTDALLNGLLDAIAWLRDKGAAGNEIKGHRDGYDTDCPGGPLYAWVRKGAPRPAPGGPVEDEPDYVSVGLGAQQALPPNEWLTLNWGAEYADSTGQHGDQGGPSLLNGPARCMLTASMVVRGLPAGTRGQIRSIEVDADDTDRFEAGPIKEFTVEGDRTMLVYGLPAEAIGAGRRLRVQLIQFGAGTAAVTHGSAKVLYWR